MTKPRHPLGPAPLPANAPIKAANSPLAKALDSTKADPAHVRSALAQAEALRNAMLALTRDLRMDELLDTLLCLVRDVIPCNRASVLLSEGETFLFVARESPPAATNRPVITLELTGAPILERVVLARRSVHLRDTRMETDWRENKPLRKIRCWMAVPLTTANTVLGLLSLGAFRPDTFTTGHFRLAKTLALPFTLAVQNARLREWALIYAAERQTLIAKVQSIRREADPKDLKN